MNISVRKRERLAYILRHDPASAGLSIQLNGWVSVDKLVENTNFRLKEIEFILATDSKNRYEWDRSTGMIRARQGHSIPVDVEFAEVSEPVELFHGTSERAWQAIATEGLRPMRRLYVHLSPSREVAEKVAYRHSSKIVILAVDSGGILASEHKLYLSSNGVYLVKFVAPELLTPLV